MAMKPRLLTSECAAHYPRLWSLVEALSHTNTIRKYPVMLNTVSVMQRFESWVYDITDYMAYVLHDQVPSKLIKYKSYGADPIVGERLEYLGENVDLLAAQDAGMAHAIVEELQQWHDSILIRTTMQGQPKYVSSVPCIECKYNSIVKYDSTYYCMNAECLHTWQKIK